ncbi:hypothetical protein BDR07DRAFT_1484419 [Suillus spraguei]|nr:hypothetical protein BDR07DRAFT_1484419 [Suillus spraguei]
MRLQHSLLDILIDTRDPESCELIRCMSSSSTETGQLYADCLPPPLCLFVPADGLMVFTGGHHGSAASRLEFIKLKRSNDFYHAHSEQFLPPLELDSVPFTFLTGVSDQDTLAQVPVSCHSLPRLQHVDIFGVLLNWAGFLCILGVGHCQDHTQR